MHFVKNTQCESDRAGKTGFAGGPSTGIDVGRLKEDVTVRDSPL